MPIFLALSETNNYTFLPKIFQNILDKLIVFCISTNGVDLNFRFSLLFCVFLETNRCLKH